METNEVINGLINTLADAVWARIDAKLKPRVEEIIKNMDVDDIIDRNDLATDIQERVESDLDVSELISECVDEQMARKDLSEYVDIAALVKEVTESNGLRSAIRSELKDVSFTVTLD